MLWLLLLRSTVNWWTGYREYDFPFRCEWCGAEALARIATQGHGSDTGLSPSQQIAYANAEQAAYWNAVSSLRGAPCFSCHRFSTAGIDAVTAVQTREQRKTRLRLPLSLGLGGATFLLLAIWALTAGAFSRMIPALGAGLTVWACCVLFMLPLAITPRLAPPQNVWFWTRGIERFGSDWVSAASAPIDQPPPPPPPKLSASAWNLLGILGVIGGPVIMVFGLAIPA